MARSRYDDEYDDRYEDEYDDRPRRGSPPPNYLAASIVVTLLCCWVFGIVAIIYAAQVDSKWASGDYRGAESASATAKMWCWLSFGSTFVIGFLYLIFVIAVVGAGGR